MRLDNSQQGIIVGIFESVKPELWDAQSVLVIVLQSQLSQAVSQVLLLAAVLLVTGPVRLVW